MDVTKRYHSQTVTAMNHPDFSIVNFTHGIVFGDDWTRQQQMLTFLVLLDSLVRHADAETIYLPVDFHRLCIELDKAALQSSRLYGTMDSFRPGS